MSRQIEKRVGAIISSLLAALIGLLGGFLGGRRNSSKRHKAAMNKALQAMKDLDIRIDALERELAGTKKTAFAQIRRLKREIKIAREQRQKYKDRTGERQ